MTANSGTAAEKRGYRPLIAVSRGVCSCSTDIFVLLQRKGDFCPNIKIGMASDLDPSENFYNQFMFTSVAHLFRVADLDEIIRANLLQIQQKVFLEKRRKVGVQ